MINKYEKRRILAVFGTRPEAIKMCPLVLELKKRDQFETQVCVTGQHREMLDQVLALFKVVPDYDLNIMRNSQSLFDITAEILTGMRDVLNEYKPDLVLVHGDTTTAFTSSLAAFYMQIDVGHVEAGLRTHDIYFPYPEEYNRQAISLVAKLNFSPTESAGNNLKAAGVSGNRIFVTGNTIIDAMKTTIRSDYQSEITKWAEGSRLLLITTHRRENLGLTMRNMLKTIRRIVEDYDDVKAVFPVHLNPAVTKIASEELSGIPNIRLITPLAVDDFHNLMNHSYLILTDSGGIQEEAPVLNKPVLTLRTVTERQEGLAAGTIKLVGTDPNDIYKTCRELLDDRKKYEEICAAKNPYGDGHASERIADIITEHFRLG